MGNEPSEISALLGDRYAIEREIGQGGMATVYLATDLRHSRRVAIKTLKPEVARAVGEQRFLREIRIAASLQHPHIVPLFDSGVEAGHCYFVMPYFESGTLRELLRAEPQLPVSRAMEIIEQVSEALDEAHRHGLVHRDLKPENVILSGEQALVSDFGIARESADATGDLRTGTGVILGTPGYMSPEQIAGSRTMDRRSDVYALGCLAYEMLGGQPPFMGPTAQVLMRLHLSMAPPSVDPLRPGLPPGAARVLQKAMAKTPSDRFNSAGDFTRALAKELRADPLADALTLSSGPNVSTPTRRSWSRRIVASVVVLLIVTGSVIAWWLWKHDYFWQNPLAGAKTERLTDFEGDEVNLAISPDGKFMTFLSDRAGQFDVWLSQIGSGEPVNVTKGKSAFAPREVIRRVGFKPDGNQIWISKGQATGPYTLSLASVVGGDPHPFLDDAMEPAWSPDGRMLAYHTAKGDPIFVADRDGRNPKQIFAGGPGIHCHYLTWSPDGRSIYFVKGFPTTDEMDIWRIPSSAATLATPERITTHNASVSDLAWLDKRTLIYSATAEDGSGQWLYAMNVERRIPHRVSSGITEQYMSVAVKSTRPRRLIASVAIPSASLWTVPISDRVQTEADVSPVSVPNVRALSPSAARDYLLFLSSKGGGDGLWKLKERAIAELWKGDDGGVVAAPAISRDGTRICFAYRQQGRSHLYLMNSNGANVHLLTDSFDVRGPASWSPDGKWVAVAGNDGKGTYVFKVPVEGGIPIRLTDTISYNPIWSPDGQMIVYSDSAQGSTLLTEAITPDKVPVPLPPKIRVSYRLRTPYRFLPDGTALIFAKDSASAGVSHLYMVNLKTGQERQLTDFRAGFQTRSFDVMPDGKQIVFDRLRENADIVLLDLRR